MGGCASMFDPAMLESGGATPGKAAPPNARAPPPVVARDRSPPVVRVREDPAAQQLQLDPAAQQQAAAAAATLLEAQQAAARRMLATSPEKGDASSWGQTGVGGAGGEADGVCCGHV